MGKATSEARQRILDTADRLFYRDGLRAVGVDRVVAEAGVAKMTLYAHFSSKDDLILAVLQQRDETMLAFFRDAMAKHAARGKDPLRSFFAALKELLASPDFRGCPFQNGIAELADASHPGSTFVREQKTRFAAAIRGYIRDTVGAVDAKVSAAVVLLVEGAIVDAVIHGRPEAADVARDAALKLVDG